MDPAFGLRFFGALFAIMNPLVTLPIFLTLTSGLAAAEQRRVGLAVTGYSAVMCLLIALGGREVLAFFGVTVDDFRVAGGIVLAGIALAMLNGSGNPAHEGGSGEKVQQRATDNIAFYPMTFPLVVGPGAITTLLVFVGEATTAPARITYAAVVAAVVALLGVTLFFSATIGPRLSVTLRVIMSRLMGMILLAIAVGMFAAGLKALFPVLDT